MKTTLALLAATFAAFLFSACKAVAATAGGLAIVHELVANGVLTQAQGDSLNAAISSGNWVTAAIVGGPTVVALILSHLKHGKTIDEMQKVIDGLPATPPVAKTAATPT